MEVFQMFFYNQLILDPYSSTNMKKTSTESSRDFENCQSKKYLNCSTIYLI